MTKLEDVVVEGGIQTGPFGSQLHASDYSAQGVGVVMPQDLGDNCINTTDMASVDEAVAQRLSRHRLRPGDIVYSRRGDITRRAFVRESDGDLLCGTGCLKVRINSEVADARFVSYAVAAPDARMWLTQHAVGATMPNLNTSILGALPIALPSLAVQRAIAEVLGALDDKIAANRKLIATSVLLAESLVAHSSSGPVKLLGEIADITMGSSPKGDTLNEDGGTVFFQGVRDFGSIYPTPRVYTHSPVKMAEPGATLLAVRAPVGQVNVAVEETCIGRGIASVRSVTPVTMFYALRAFESRWDIYQGAGTVFSSVSGAEVRGFQIPTVPESSVSGLEAQVAAVHSRALAAERESEELARTRDELLPLLMSGKITVEQAETQVEEVV